MNGSLLSELMTMHRFCRPAGSATEYSFNEHYVASLPGCERDQYGNYHVIVANERRIVFSCHTDTVHQYGSMQRVSLSTDGILHAINLQKHHDRRRVEYIFRSPDCLGADDTAGVFLCRQMILAGVPGHYIFHYGEELGCEGSGALAHYSPELIADAQMAIAFDRKDHGDVITHQCGMRTCSDAFARSLAQAIGGKYAPSDRGLYTDTRSYDRLIPECTNISIGYNGAHGASETLDVNHVMWLLSRLIRIDYASLVVERDPLAPMDRESFTSVHDLLKWRDYTNTDNDAASYLDSWECIVCSRMNRWDTELCFTCGEERDHAIAIRAVMDAKILQD